MRRFFTHHPKAILALTFAELCDRLSFYGILAVLVLYLPQHFHISYSLALSVFGIYITLGFATPVVGGLVADSFIGNYRSVVTGSLLMSLGCFVASLNSLNDFFLGLSILVIGIGLMKSPVTSQLGMFYPDGDARKKVAYTLFYVGMNIGAMLGPLTLSFLNFDDKYTAGLQIAAALNLIGAIVYISFGLKGHLPRRHDSPVKKWNIGRLLVFYTGLIIAIIGTDYLFQDAKHFSDTLLPFGAIIAIILTGLTLNQTGQARRNMILLFLLTLITMFYFACAKQAESSVLMFISNDINRTIFNYNIPASSFTAIKPFAIILFAFCAAPLWQSYCKRRQQPQTLTLIALGLIFAAIGFVLFGFAADMVGNDKNSTLMVLILGYMFLGIGEICIMPTVTSSVSDLAPKNIQSTMMGVWFLSLAFSGYLSAIIAQMIADSSANTHASQIYAKSFLEIAMIAIIIALACYATGLIAKRLFRV